MAITLQDPAAEVRKMYKDTLALTVQVYDTVAPAGAGDSLPYAVIRSVDAVPIPVRGSSQPEYRAVVNIDILTEFREFGGSAELDALSSAIMQAMIGDQKNLPACGPFSHFLSKLLRTTTTSEYIASVQGFGKRVTIEHWLKLQSS